MELFQGLPASGANDPGSVVTIGSFDGVHLGHQRLVRRVRAIAERRGLIAGAVTFDPHPRSVVAPSGCPPLLSTLSERVDLLGRAGAERVVVLAFTPELRTWSADRFAAALVDRLAMRQLVVGPGFALGRGREGDITFLRTLGRERGFRVTSVPPARRGGGGRLRRPDHHPRRRPDPMPPGPRGVRGVARLRRRLAACRDRHRYAAELRGGGDHRGGAS